MSGEALRDLKLMLKSARTAWDLQLTRWRFIESYRRMPPGVASTPRTLYTIQLGDYLSKNREQTWKIRYRTLKKR
jgi:hypothetical protein